jgi:hypothetical protein
MRRNLATEHPDDAALLGYLDAELSRMAMRRTEKHLQSCWKCRSALAELEYQAQGISRLLAHQDDSDIARTQNAKPKFLSLRSLETLREEPPRKAGSPFSNPEPPRQRFAVTRVLQINEAEATTVRTIFNQFLRLGNVTILRVWLHENDICTKSGGHFFRGALYEILHNPLYIGLTRHKTNT